MNNRAAADREADNLRRSLLQSVIFHENLRVFSYYELRQLLNMVGTETRFKFSINQNCHTLKANIPLVLRQTFGCRRFIIYCSRSGQQEGPLSQKCECRAKIILELQDERYLLVTEFVAGHNHPPSRRPFEPLAAKTGILNPNNGMLTREGEVPPPLTFLQLAERRGVALPELIPDELPIPRSPERPNIPLSPPHYPPQNPSPPNHPINLASPPPSPPQNPSPPNHPINLASPPPSPPQNQGSPNHPIDLASPPDSPPQNHPQPEHPINPELRALDAVFAVLTPPAPPPPQRNIIHPEPFRSPGGHLQLPPAQLFPVRGGAPPQVAPEDAGEMQGRIDECQRRGRELAYTQAGLAAREAALVNLRPTYAAMERNVTRMQRDYDRQEEWLAQARRNLQPAVERVERWRSRENDARHDREHLTIREQELQNLKDELMMEATRRGLPVPNFDDSSEEEA